MEREPKPGASPGETNHRIRDWAPSERPRDRLAELGPTALTAAELLAILLRTGLPGENAVQMGQRLLQKYGGIGGIHRASYEEFVEERGMGPAKAGQVKAAIELGRRLNSLSPEERPVIHSPADAAELVRYEMSGFEQEHLRVIYLNTRNAVLGMEDLYRGSINSAQIRVGEVFKGAIRRNAAAIIVCHNHPSGDSSPSPDDVAITRVLAEAGKLLDIELLDHLIVGRGNFVSLKERHLGF